VPHKLNKADPFFIGIVGNRLSAIAAEQQATLLRTAFSTIVRDNEDLACGVFSSTGRMIAQSVTGTPGHINPMATGVRHFLKTYPPTSLRPGDVLVTNDPWLTTGQLNDFTVVTPVFHADQLVAFLANTCHSPDVGGRLLSGEAFEIFEEGLRVPVIKLFENGEPNSVLFDLIRSNVRTPEETVGDLYAQTACNAQGARRIVELLDEFALIELDDIADQLFDRTEAAIRRALTAIPDGVYTAAAQADGFDDPVTIRVTITINGDRAKVDFGGSSRQSDRGINVVLSYAAGYASFAFKALVAADVPHNDGSFRPITVTAPIGSILNPQEPAAVAGRHLVGHFIPGLIFAALSSVVSGVIAGGADPVWVITWNGPWPRGKRRAFTFSSFHVGGMGARANKDGLSTTGFPTGVAGAPTEVVEQVSPLVQEYRKLRPDSGGAGTFRGGLGQEVAYRCRTGKAWSVAASIDRTKFPGKGIGTGMSGATGFIRRNGCENLPAKRRVDLFPNDCVEFGLPGGAGYGSPSLRDPMTVRDDVAAGYISLEAARAQYKVAIAYTGSVDALVRTPESFDVLWEETARLRASEA
jgi:N-methylhydantoinase B